MRVSEWVAGDLVTPGAVEPASEPVRTFYPAEEAASVPLPKMSCPGCLHPMALGPDALDMLLVCYSCGGALRLNRAGSLRLLGPGDELAELNVDQAEALRQVRLGIRRLETRRSAALN